MSATSALNPRVGELYSHTAIRGIAALCVVGYHGMLGSVGNDYSDNLVQNYFLTSFIFVDFFFMLSGFIMFESYGKKFTGSNILNNSFQYWKKRLVKILPNYYFWLIISITLSFSKWYYFGDSTISNECLRNSLIEHSLLIQNIVDSCYYFNVPLWSIAVELFAYLVFPMIMLLRIGAFSSLLIGVFLYIFLFSRSETIDIIGGYYSIIRCLAGFFCGIAAAKMQKKVWPDFVQIAIILLLIFAIAGNFQILALSLMFLVTITTAQNTGIIAKASQKQIPYVIGRSSFSIYLAHVPVGMVVTVVAYKLERELGVPIGSDWKVIMPIEMFTSCVVGVFAYSIVERRFENWFYRRKRQPQIV